MNMPLKADGTVEFRATLFAVIRHIIHHTRELTVIAFNRPHIGEKFCSYTIYLLSYNRISRRTTVHSKLVYILRVGTGIMSNHTKNQDN